MERNQRKKIGRFIKKTDTILSVVALKDFSFEIIGDQKLIQFDNPGGNVILTRYHESSEIERGVTRHASINSEVREQEKRLPILQPIDFTKDWRRQQERASKRKKGRSDDDDDFEIEYEMALIDKQMKARVEADSTPVPASAPAPAPAAPAPSNNVAQLSDLEISESQKYKSVVDSQANNLDEVSKAINEVANATGADMPQTALHITRDEDQQREEAPVVIPPTKQPSFEVFSPELAAMKEYREVLNNPELTPENLRQAIEAAKSQGYQDGFQQGESKATIQLQSVTKQVVDNVGGILTEMEHLRRGVLEGAEKNFYEVCQALSEALIGHELSINQNSFSQLITNLIREHVGDDNFKIAVHPEFHAQLKKMKITQLDNKLIEDTELKVGDFRIESQQAVIDGNLKQMITDLLKKADLKLFSDAKDKAS